MLALLGLLAAMPIAILPASASEVPAAAVSEAQAALGRALPAPFEAARLDLRMLQEHLAAAGPGCRVAPACVCAAAPFEAGVRALDLEVSKLSERAWAADLKLVAPCEDQILDRRASVVEAGAAALARFVSEAAEQMLRGRDLGPLRYAAAPTPAPEPRAVALSEAAEAYQRGLAYLDRSAYSAAEQSLTHAIDLSPGYATAFAARGKARLFLEQTSPALEDFRRARELDAALSFPVYGLAEAHRRLGDRAAAIRFFEAYLGMTAAPDNSADLRRAASLWIQSLRKPE